MCLPPKKIWGLPLGLPCQPCSLIPLVPFSCCLRSPGCLHLFPWEAIPSSQDLLPCVGSLAVQDVLPCPVLSSTLLGPLLVGGSVTAVQMRRPRCSVVSVHFLYLNQNDAKLNTTKTNREAQKQSALNRVNLPQTQVGKRVPKYGSQSETTIDSCP